jgi:trimeric autotransporter adhesin
MTLILSGTNGVSDIDGSAATPAIRGTDANTGIFFPAADTIAFSEGGVESMRVDSSGNVGIGTSSPSRTLEVRNVVDYQLRLGYSGGAYYDIGRSGTSGYLSFYGSQTAYTGYVFGGVNGERMRINSSGNLLVGATSFPSTSSKFFVAGTAISQNGVIQAQSNTAGDVSYSALYLSKFDNNSTTSQILVRFAINNYGAGQGQINGNGANAAAFGTFSDSRLKENIVDLPSQLSNIMALRPVEYDYIASEGGGHQIGFVAQDVQAVYPDLVGEREDGMLTLSDMNKNDARIIKAIQEQQALITGQQAMLASLTARIEALEQA